MRELVIVSMINECFASEYHQMQEIYNNHFRSKHGNMTVCQAKNGKHECNEMIAKYLISPDRLPCCNVSTRNNNCEFLAFDSVNLQSVH